MVRALIIIFSFLISTVLIYTYLSSTSDEKKAQTYILENDTKTSKKSVNQNAKESNGIFVPYWTVGANLDISTYDEVYYFGVAVDDQGLNTNEAGFTALPQFRVNIPAGTTSYLTIRMLNFDTNSNVLKSQVLQEAIINESIDLAKEYDFSGIVLDFEMNGLAFDSFISTINAFYERWYKSVKQSDLKFYITLYGDVFYRARPYDVAFLGKNTDKILILTYDFHKARGNPGPNFPLAGKAMYGYDVSQMISDFTSVVPLEKLAVVFGLFGYDWEVSDAQTSISNGKALSYYQIKDRFLDKCSYSSCKIITEIDSGETKIEYSDKGVNHIVWFEDETSMTAKKALLREKGIHSFAAWAYNYF